MQINLLLVDDVKENLYALEVILEELEFDHEDFKGLNICKAQSGDEALRLTLKQDFDLILLDVRMPGMDGFEVASILKSTKKTAHIPIVFLTAEFKSEEFVAKGYKVGALDYFTKPIEKFSFLNKMKLYIELFLTQKLQAKEFNDTLANYMKLMDEHIISTDTDLRGNITRVSSAFCKMCGYSQDELLRQTYKVLRDPNTNEELYRDMWDTISKDEVWQGQIKNLDKDDEEYWIDALISSKYDKNHKKIGYTAIMNNITSEKKLELMSITDPLTGLHNRRYFNTIAQQVISSAKRYNKKWLCFSIMDIDFFKKYNDTYGHQAGDKALVKVAQVFKQNTNRPDDYSFRIGGEEFSIIFLAETKEKAVDYINNIKQKVQELKIEHKKSSVSDFITISVGLSCSEGAKIDTLEALYNHTDELLYKAKEKGRNQVVSD